MGAERNRCGLDLPWVCDVCKDGRKLNARTTLNVDVRSVESHLIHLAICTHGCKLWSPGSPGVLVNWAVMRFGYSSRLMKEPARCIIQVED